MRSHGEVLVELTPEQVVLSLMRNGRVELPHVSNLVARNEGRIASAANSYREALAKLVAELGVQNMRARVLFTSPEAGAGVFSCAKRAGGAAAERAALLALGESTSLDVTQEPHAVLTVAVDERDVEGVAQIHTLGVAVADNEIEALRDIIEGAGLQFAGAIPSIGLGLLAGVTAAIPVSHDGVCIFLHMGGRDSTIVGATQGRLRFVRQTPIGLESLVDVLSRDPMLDEFDAPHRLSREQAHAVLFTQGIPAPGQRVKILPKVQSKAVLPLLQSTLQRLSLEVKQSTRFGLSESDRERASLRIGGAGARVGRLAEIIGEMSGLEAVEAFAGGASAEGMTDLEAWESQPELTLFPREVAKQRTARDLQKRVIAGTALALMALGATWAKTSYDISRGNDEITTLSASAQRATESQTLADQVRAANVALAAVRDSLEAASPTRVRVQGLMLALSEATSKHVRLLSVEVDAQDGGGLARISGKVLPEAGHDGATVLGSFIDRLGTTPTVRQCKLASTRKGSGQDEGAIFFEMAVEVVRLPGGSMLTMDRTGEDGR